MMRRPGALIAGVVLLLAVPARAADTGAAGAPDAGLPVIIAPDGGDVVWFFQESPETLGSGGELRIYIDHATHAEARGSFAKFTLGVGGALPIHRHHKTEEIAYIIAGAGVAVGVAENGDEVEMPISAGYIWYNPPSAWHAVRNTGDEPLAMVFATIPNEEQGLLSFFRKIGNTPGAEAKVIAADDFARMAAEHDMIMRPPVEEKSASAANQ